MGGGGESGPSIRRTVGEVKAACGHQREDQSAASILVSQTNTKRNLSKTASREQPGIMGKETPQTPRTRRPTGKAGWPPKNQTAETTTGEKLA